MKLTDLKRDQETGNILFQLELNTDEHQFLLFVAISNLIRAGALHQAQLEAAVEENGEIEIDLSKIPNEAFYKAS